MDINNSVTDGGGDDQKAMAQRVMQLFGSIDETLNELNVPEGERGKVMQNLMDSIAADLLHRLSDRMNPEDQEELMEMTSTLQTDAPDLHSVASFFRKRFTQEELMGELTTVTEGVLAEFVSEVKKGME